VGVGVIVGVFAGRGVEVFVGIDVLVGVGVVVDVGLSVGNTVAVLVEVGLDTDPQAARKITRLDMAICTDFIFLSSATDGSTIHQYQNDINRLAGISLHPCLQILSRVLGRQIMMRRLSIQLSAGQQGCFCVDM
jgi:hypothetical protein